MQNYRDVDDVPQWPIDEHVVVSFGEAERPIDPLAAIILVNKQLQDKVWNCGMVMAIDPLIRRIDFEWPAIIITGKFYNQPILKTYTRAILEWIDSNASEAIAEEDAVSGFVDVSRFLKFNNIWISVTKSGEHVATSLHCSIGGLFNYCTSPISCLEGPVIWQNKEMEIGSSEIDDEDTPF